MPKIKQGLPEVMWFGTTDGEWPIQTFPSEEMALAWLRGESPTGIVLVRKRRIWRATVSDPVEYEAVVPEPYLKAKEA